MSDTIWLLRHARADTGGPGMDDIDRPLSHDGRHQASRLGEWMQQQGLRPDLVISSPAVRARQTTELVCKPLGYEMLNVHFDPGLYLASRNNLIEIISTQSRANGPIMFVGHNPGLEELLNWLCQGPLSDTADGIQMSTANLARIQLAGDGRLVENSGRLIDLIRSDDLP